MTERPKNNLQPDAHLVEKSNMKRIVTFALLLTAGWCSTAAAQGQFPSTDEERILPYMKDVMRLPALIGRRSDEIQSLPIWHLPLGTEFRFLHSRRLVPHGTKYALGYGIMANQFMHVEPSDQLRDLTTDGVWTLDQTGPVYGKHLYSPHLLQSYHTIQMRLVNEEGFVIELEICPGANCLPTVAQFEEYFEITPPAFVEIVD